MVIGMIILTMVMIGILVLILIKEYRNALWAVDRNGNTLSPNIPDPRSPNHGLDATRYGMETLRPIEDESYNFDAPNPWISPTVESNF